MHAPFLGMHQEPKNKNRPGIRAVVRGDSLSELCVPRIERLPAQGTVASPGPVAGSDVTIGPLLMLVHLLAVVLIVVNGTEVLSLVRRSVRVLQP